MAPHRQERGRRPFVPPPAHLSQEDIDRAVQLALSYPPVWGARGILLNPLPGPVRPAHRCDGSEEPQSVEETSTTEEPPLNLPRQVTTVKTHVKSRSPRVMAQHHRPARAQAKWEGVESQGSPTASRSRVNDPGVWEHSEQGTKHHAGSRVSDPTVQQDEASAGNASSGATAGLGKQAKAGSRVNDAFLSALNDRGSPAKSPASPAPPAAHNEPGGNRVTAKAQQHHASRVNDPFVREEDNQTR